MLVLGLGTNLGDRIENLNLALKLLRSSPNLSVIKISPLYLSDALLLENHPPSWNLPYLNCAVSCTTTLPPLDLLTALKQIEIMMGREKNSKTWSPRIIDIDILVWDDLKMETNVLTIPHPQLIQRPFALWPLTDIAPFEKCENENSEKQTVAQIAKKWGSKFDGLAPFHTKQINQKIEEKQLVGILNITPDSFSDAGEFLQPDSALIHAIKLVKDGATVIDIGAESTAPTSHQITQSTEWKRLQPILEILNHQKKRFLLPPKISIDTRNVKTAELALEMGVDWINDVSGLQEPEMRNLIKNSNSKVVMMHHLALPENRNISLNYNEDSVEIVLNWFELNLESLLKEGFNIGQIIIDPGIGFGKKPEQSFQILNKISEFKKFKSQILIGHSRKSFLSLLCEKIFNERDIETCALLLKSESVDYFRVHNVDLCARALKAFNY